MWETTKRNAAAILVLTVLLGTNDAFGRVVSVPVQLGEGPKGSVALQTEGISPLGETLTIREHEAITFADLTFNDELPVGTEIEVWPAVEGETPPWELSGEGFPFQRNLWITDDRTGSFVRFDVTDIVRAWESERIPNLGFVLRITNEENPEEQSQAASQYVFKTPEKVVLNYHILPVRPPKTDAVIPPREGNKDPKKVPRTQDGKNNWSCPDSVDGSFLGFPPRGCRPLGVLKTRVLQVMTG